MSIRNIERTKWRSHVRGRRVQKIAPDGTHTFLYDGWRPVVEMVARSGGGTDRIEYHWGKDLSGTLDGAAGVGGLLYMKRNGEIYVPFGDDFGNVMGYWDEQGAIVAEYSYDAFGSPAAASPRTSRRRSAARRSPSGGRSIRSAASRASPLQDPRRPRSPTRAADKSPRFQTPMPSPDCIVPDCIVCG